MQAFGGFPCLYTAQLAVVSHLPVYMPRQSNLPWITSQLSLLELRIK